MRNIVVLHYLCASCPPSAYAPSVVAGDSRSSTFGGLHRLRGVGLSTLSTFDPPSSSVFCASSCAGATFRGRGLGRFGSSSAVVSSAWAKSSSGSGGAGCLPFPLAEARFLGVGRVVLEGSPCSPPPSGGPTLAVAFAFPFLRVSYLALHWITKVNIRSGKT